MVRTSYHGQCTCTEALVQTQIQIAISRPGHRDAWRPVFTDSRLFLNRLRRDIHRDSIFELSVNTTSGAPSFVRSLRKGWETTDIHRNCRHPGRKRTIASANKYQQPSGAPSGRPLGTTSLFLWLGWGSTKTVFICRIYKVLDSSPSTPANPPQEPRAPSLRIVSAARVGSHSPQPAKPLPSLILFQMHAQKLLNPLQVRRIEPGIGPERMLSSLGLKELYWHIRSLQRIGKSNRFSERHALIHRSMPHIKRRRAAMHMKQRRSILALPRHRRALTAQIIRHRG